MLGPQAPPPDCQVPEKGPGVGPGDGPGPGVGDGPGVGPGVGDGDNATGTPFCVGQPGHSQ